MGARKNVSEDGLPFTDKSTGPTLFIGNGCIWCIWCGFCDPHEPTQGSPLTNRVSHRSRVTVGLCSQHDERAGKLKTLSQRLRHQWGPPVACVHRPASTPRTVCVCLSNVCVCHLMIQCCIIDTSISRRSSCIPSCVPSANLRERKWFAQVRYLGGLACRSHQ